MSRKNINEEHCLVFVRSALEVSVSNYEKMLSQRASGTRERRSVKKKDLQREIAEYHLRLGDLIERFERS